MRAGGGPGGPGGGAGLHCVGNYRMTGRVLGKGHFARVEEATHRLLGRRVAVKVLDAALLREEYARRHAQREPRLMARLRHPCIAALYETLSHGSRLYLVMEAAGGGDLCALVVAARPRPGLPETRARTLAAQLVSAVRHMHGCGVVHRDLKMENIMLDSTKQLIKIVDFGLSNLWSAGAALRTPCGSLEYAAPELFVDGRRYGPEVDLWSVSVSLTAIYDLDYSVQNGVIVYGMVTGGLPFTAPEGAGGGEGRDRPLLRQVIARGFGRKQRAALTCVSTECRSFVQRLLEPDVTRRMKSEEAARDRWVRRAGMRMKLHPLGPVDARLNREVYRQISEVTGTSVSEVASAVRADPFGAEGGMYNMQVRALQLQGSAHELLWTSLLHEPRAESPACLPPTPAAPHPPQPTHHHPGGDARLPCIEENAPPVRKTAAGGLRRPGEGTARSSAGVWRAAGAPTPTRVLLHATSNIKRASLGNIVSPHSSTNSQCKSERAAPTGGLAGMSAGGWLSRTSRDPPHAPHPHLSRYRKPSTTTK